MSSATLQLFDVLDGFKALHAVGENPSANEIGEMFRLLDDARAEASALSVAHELRIAMAGGAHARRVVDAFNQDAPAATPRSAEPSHPAEGSARVRPSIDQVEASLQKALKASATNRERAHRAARASRRQKPAPKTPARRKGGSR